MCNRRKQFQACRSRSPQQERSMMLQRHCAAQAHQASARRHERRGVWTASSSLNVITLTLPRPSTSCIYKGHRHSGQSTWSLPRRLLGAVSRTARANAHIRPARWTDVRVASPRSGIVLLQCGQQRTTHACAPPALNAARQPQGWQGPRSSPPAQHAPLHRPGAGHRGGCRRRAATARQRFRDGDAARPRWEAIRPAGGLPRWPLSAPAASQEISAGRQGLKRPCQNGSAVERVPRWTSPTVDAAARN
jgi:hypothetical protein